MGGQISQIKDSAQHSNIDFGVKYLDVVPKAHMWVKVLQQATTKSLLKCTEEGEKQKNIVLKSFYNVAESNRVHSA